MNTALLVKFVLEQINDLLLSFFVKDRDLTSKRLTNARFALGA